MQSDRLHHKAIQGMVAALLLLILFSVALAALMGVAALLTYLATTMGTVPFLIGIVILIAIAGAIGSLIENASRVGSTPRREQ